MSPLPVQLRPYSELETVGVAVQWHRTHDQVHTGILVRLDDKSIRLCHLEFHHRLKFEEPTNGYFWADCQRFSGSVERNANGFFFSVWVQDVADNPSIPYGFAFDAHCFDEDGRYRPMEVGKGLTCATFIIAVFHSAALPVILPDTWHERPEDQEWQKKILELLEGRASKEHVMAAASYVGHFRYRPEEVASAAVQAPPPLTLDDCIPLANELLAAIGAR
jgi:hypothetical protein